MENNADKENNEDNEIRISTWGNKHIKEEDRKRAIELFEKLFDNWDELKK